MFASMASFFEDLKLTIGSINISDIIEILIMSFFIYKLIVWVRDTRTWVLLRGILVIIIFFIIAEIFHLDTILYIAKALLDIVVIAIVIIFQPELRAALERIGKNNIITKFRHNTKTSEDGFNEEIVDQLCKASYELASAKTGALMVIERQDNLDEFIKTGISVDGVVTSQLLVNIFEHNTPLHDGAVIVRENRIVAATCYLPLSSNASISKAYGTRHRAGLGVSEVTDSITIIVSEETGNISIAMEGKLFENVSGQTLRETLEKLIVMRREAKHFRIPWKKNAANKEQEEN